MTKYQDLKKLILKKRCIINIKTQWIWQISGQQQYDRETVTQTDDITRNRAHPYLSAIATCCEVPLNIKIP